MRHDIKHKIMEVNHKHDKEWYKNARKNIRPVDYYNNEYDDKTHEPIRKHGYTCTNIHVVNKIIKSQIGRKWDDVYSELVSGIKAGTFERNELEYAIGYTVNLKPLFIDGIPHYSDISIWHNGYIELTDGDLYVDEEGILKTYKRKKR